MVSHQVYPDMMNIDFQQFRIFCEYVAINELTVKGYGCNSLTEFMHGTPGTFGCKVWAHCGISWYSFNFN